LKQCGAIAFITNQYWLNKIYDQLQASGLLLWVVITGMITTLISSYGFIGAKSFDPSPTKKYSFQLLIFSVIAFSLSFAFRGNKFLSELVPFIGLFVSQVILQEKFQRDLT